MNLKEKQDKEFKEIIFHKMTLEFRATYGDKHKIEEFVDKVRKETAECVCDKMIGEKQKVKMNAEGGMRYFSVKGYNTRIKEEKEIKIKIIKELC